MKNLPVAIPETAQGRIITSVGGLYTVETFSGICTCKARGIFRKRGITPYVGDYVQLSEDGVIQEILPRKNSILRPPVSNLDQIFFVVSTCHPAPNLLLLDSFLTVAIYQDIQPAVVLTKMDLHSGEQLEKLYTDARHSGVSGGIRQAGNGRRRVRTPCRKNQHDDRQFRRGEVHAAQRH